MTGKFRTRIHNETIDEALEVCSEVMAIIRSEEWYAGQPLPSAAEMYIVSMVADKLRARRWA